MSSQRPAANILVPTVVRMDDKGEWWLMNRKDRGWSSLAIGPYLALDQVREAWNVEIGRAGADRHSTYREVFPRQVSS